MSPRTSQDIRASLRGVRAGITGLNKALTTSCSDLRRCRLEAERAALVKVARSLVRQLIEERDAAPFVDGRAA